MQPRFAWAALVRNPFAGTGGGDPARLRDALAEAGVSLVETVTRGPGHAARIAGDFANAGAPLVIAWGGDGTVTEVARGVVGTPAALGVIPRGTVNVLARETGIPFDVAAAARVLTGGRVVEFRPGALHSTTGTHLFVAVASIGLDAETARRMAARGRRGIPLWIATGLGVFLTARLPRLHVTAGDRRERAAWVGCGRQPRFVHSLRLFPDARLTGEKLGMTLLRSWTRWGYLGGALAARLGALRRFPPALSLPVEEAWIDSKDAPAACEADGNPAGTTPVWVGVWPEPLRIVLPASGLDLDDDGLESA